jgi:glycosyltransferase involved in cell wall biosynthesis
MDVVHITSWLSRRGGGIPPVIRALAHQTARLGNTVSVVGLRDEWAAGDFKNDGFQLAAEEIIGPAAFGFSPGLNKQLQERAQPKGIIHSHGLWMYPGLAARKSAKKNGSKLLVSPHGMLEPWALNHSSWKKKLAERFFESKNLRESDCLHALCVAEAENFRRYGLKNPIAIIPNGVDLEDSAPSSGEAIIEKFPDIRGRRRILFLSRLHSKKGLTNLLQAWQRLAHNFKDWQLLIAGSGEPTYENELKASSRDLISDKSVVFLGPVYGSDKNKILAASDAFILPSFSEGFSMAILEAAAAGLPVLLTPECNFPELTASNAAIEISTDVSGIEKGLRQVIGLPEEQRKAMGQHGQNLVQKSYTWPSIAAQMCRVYDWLVGVAERPETVKLA